MESVTLLLIRSEFYDLSFKINFFNDLKLILIPTNSATLSAVGGTGVLLYT